MIFSTSFYKITICILTILIVYLRVEINHLKDISLKKNLYLNEIRARDFLFYDCQSIKRIGGDPKFVRHAPNELWRIDGAWFICMDKNAKPKKSNCNVISLGISRRVDFEQDIRNLFDCNLFAFDPFVEADYFKQIRDSNKELKSSPVLNGDKKWKFYRLGLTGVTNKNRKLKDLRITDMISFDELLDITEIRNQVIDILKIDIEGAEKDVFRTLDMEYACKYIKNFVFETHLNLKFENLVKLEKCFRLFYRTTRFFEIHTVGKTGRYAEFQDPDGWKINLKKWGNEINLANFMFVSGEIYFVNKNFL